MIAERIGALPHLVSAPRKPVASPLAHAAPPAAPERLEPTRAGAARRRHEAAARRARVVRVDGTHEVEVVLSARKRLGAVVAATGMLDGVGAKVPVDDNVWGARARRHMVVVEIAVCTHCWGAAG